MYRDTITLFCYYNGIWRATTLSGVDLNADRAAILARYGENSNDRAKLHIRYEAGSEEGIRISDGIVAVPPNDYRGEEGTITFASGENFSFFIRGVPKGDSVDVDFGRFNPWEVATPANGGAFVPWNDGIVIDANGILRNDDFYPQGFYNYMNAKYGEVYAVSSVAVYSVIPHFEIMGK